MTTDPQRLLVVDDDPKFCALVHSGLTETGFACSTAGNAAEALSLLRTSREPFDVVLLDIMMPQMSGWDVLMRVREEGIRIPVIFVTAREAVEERVQGLRMGADDYIIKPFAFVELVARIETVIRRRKELTRLQVGELHLDLTKRCVRLRNQPADLSPKEFDLLRMLAESRGRVVSRRELLREVWQTEHDPGTNVVEVHVARLRRKLAIAGGPLIQNVRGKGYTLSERGHRGEGG